MPDKTVLFRPKFKPDVDAKLREHVKRRGELVKLIVLILKTVDLSTVPLLELSSGFQDLLSTTVHLPVALHDRLKRVAEKRHSTMNALLNSAVWAYKKESPDEEP